MSVTQAPGKLQFINNKPRIRALRAIREWIKDGRLPEGERLPSEELLATRLKVARSAIRGALKQLEDEGVLTPEGRGRVVKSAASSGRVGVTGSAVLSQTMAFFTDAPGEIPSNQKSGGWWHHVQTGAIAAIRNAGLHALVAQPERLVGEELERFIAERPRGVIALRDALLPEAGRSVLQALRTAKIPVVVYGSTSEFNDYDRVSSDHAAGCYKLTKWLIGQGRQRILRYWMMPASAETHPGWLKERNAGYERAVREAGLDVLPPLEAHGTAEYPSTPELFDMQARLCVGYLLDYMTPGKKPIDAVMVASDGLIYPVASAIRKFGLEPNKDVAIVGYDNYWIDVPERRFNPIMPQATVDKKNLQIGKALVDLFLARERGQLGPDPVHIAVEPELIVLGAGR